MFAVALFYSLALLFFSAANALPSLPPLMHIASRGSPRQIDAFLDAHNQVRAKHHAAPLQWSASLAQKAAVWADKCQFKNTEGVLSTTRYGENIAAGTGGFSIRDAVATFVSDESSYDPAHPSYLRFTQVVWKSTTDLGCAVSQCDGIFDKAHGKANLVVCLYNPVGNVIGQASQNVEI